MREYSSRFRGPALSLYRHMDPYPSLGHASVTHTDMMGQCNQIGRDQSRVLCLLLGSQMGEGSAKNIFAKNIFQKNIFSKNFEQNIVTKNIFE